ncbi:hypothetical protein BDA96_02G214600 [Sorghum bicolor]|uniref:Uncharacterized protein n=1 Tax=Sorghum bicolor TaxID=4558 RepID=A0A921RPB0_SORBI|nr:hypothetical protein BDA96_02G214600 [Sorghum bicolor]
MSAAAVAPGAARRRLSQSPKPPGARDNNNKEPPPPPEREDDADKQAAKARRRLLLPSLSSPSPTRGAAASMLLRRAAGAVGGPGSSSRYVHPSSSLSVSCASEASTESFCSRASTGRIGRRPAGPPVGAPRRRAAGSAGPPSARPAATATTSRKVAGSGSSVVVPAGGAAAAATVQVVVPPVFGLLNGEPTAAAASAGPPRCPWVTPNTDPCYAAFHDKEWGVPVHDDKKLFEMLTLSGALAEMAWPAILSKRDTFREVFMNFDPQLVAKLNEKKFLAPCSPASSLLSQHRLRIIIENARELLKVIDEFGSFDSYCWSFMSNNRPMVGGYRNTREVPLRTAKADAISQDLMRRGFLGVGPTVVYAFMQAVGMANDHLVTCYRFEECCDIIKESPAAPSEGYDGDNGKKPPPASDQEVSMLCGLVQCVA